MDVRIGCSDGGGYANGHCFEHGGSYSVDKPHWPNSDTWIKDISSLCNCPPGYQFIENCDEHQKSIIMCVYCL